MIVTPICPEVAWMAGQSGDNLQREGARGTRPQVNIAFRNRGDGGMNRPSRRAFADDHSQAQRHARQFEGIGIEVVGPQTGP